MIGVDLGDEERDVGGEPVGARVADDDVAGLGKGVLVAGGGLGVEGGEEKLRRAAANRSFDAEVARELRDAAAEQPGELAVTPAFGSLAGGHPGQSEPRVPLEAPDQLLPDHPGGPENPDVPTLGHRPRPFNRSPVSSPVRETHAGDETVTNENPPAGSPVRRVGVVRVVRLLLRSGHGSPADAGHSHRHHPHRGGRGGVEPGWHLRRHPTAGREGCQALCIAIYLCMDIVGPARRRAGAWIPPSVVSSQ